jgi:Ala-tRNA(Pro) deacylase
MYIVEFLQTHRIWFQPLLHQPASSSTKRAHSVHVTGSKVAKAVLVHAGDRFVLVVVPSTARIELDRLSALLAVPSCEVRLATPDELVSTFPECEPGVVPPFGRLYGLDTIFDSSLADVDEIVFGGNTRHEGLRMRSRDYVAIEQPRIGSVTVPIACRQPRHLRSHPGRRAG